MVTQSETAAIKAKGSEKSKLFTRDLTSVYTKSTLVSEDFSSFTGVSDDSNSNNNNSSGNNFYKNKFGGGGNRYKSSNNNNNEMNHLQSQQEGYVCMYVCMYVCVYVLVSFNHLFFDVFSFTNATIEAMRFIIFCTIRL